MSRQASGGIRDSIFISYSHDDQIWLDKFREMLSGQDTMRIWTDHDINGGEDWNNRIRTEIAQTRIALLLVSPSFLSSDFIRREELPLILQAREEGLVVKWVLVRSTPMSNIPDELTKLQSFKIHQSAKTALSELSEGEADAEVSSICERIIENMARFLTVPRHDFLRSVQEATRRFGYTVREEIATGDYSVVFRAEEAGGYVIIKALVNLALDDWREDWRKQFEHDLEKASELKGPAFIGLRRWILDTTPRVLVTDYIDARNLSRELRLHRRLPVDQVRYIIQVLAEALSECHRNGFAYGSIKPSDVLMEPNGNGPPIPRIPAYRFAQMVHRWEDHCRTFLINQERLTYIVPEQYHRGEFTEKSDQYSLGLLAIEMLQGKPPVRIRHLQDLEEKKRFFEDPAGYGGEWLARSPSLTRVILKMLEPDPAKRWSSMADIALELGGGQSVIDNNRRLAKGSYMRLMERRGDFYHSFYEKLFRKRKTLTSKFGNGHDWEHHYKKMDSAVCSLLNFSEEHARCEPTILTHIASKHRKLALMGKDFDAFEQAFIETLPEFDEGSEEMQGAWRVSFAAGINYMKAHATGTEKEKKAMVS